MNAIGQSYPLRRYGLPMECAHAAAFLANNDESAFMTGVIMPVDGGFLVNSATETTMNELVKSMSAAAVNQ